MEQIISDEVLQKYGFNKTEKNRRAFWNDYLLENISPSYGYFLHCTIHVPKYVNEKNIDYSCYELVLHRYYSYDQFSKESEYYDFELIYKGRISNESDLRFILEKTEVLDIDQLEKIK